jgi:hypothetical protein
MTAFDDLLSGCESLYSGGLFESASTRRAKSPPTFTGCPDRVRRGIQLYADDGYVLPEVPTWVPERNGHYPYPWDQCPDHLTIDDMSTDDATHLHEYLMQTWTVAEVQECARVIGGGKPGPITTRDWHRSSDWSALRGLQGKILIAGASGLPYVIIFGLIGFVGLLMVIR